MVALAAFTLSLEVWSPFEKKESAAYVSTNITYHNTLVEQLPEYIQVRYNNLGFIGEDFRDSITRPRVFFVGWSNTQSLYVTEGKKWTDFALADAKVWHNNAAADGTLIPSWCKIIGSLQYQKPDYVVALIDPFVGLKEKPKKRSDGITGIISHLRIVDQILLPYLHSLREIKIGHKTVDWAALPAEGGQHEFIRLSTQDSLSVVAQLDSLRNAIQAVGAMPIFISAPTPYGNYTDGAVNMGEKEKSVATDLQYQEFNAILKSYCQMNDCCFVNGYALQKKTAYFYDYSHFTYEGSEAFGLLVRGGLKNCFSTK